MNQLTKILEQYEKKNPGKKARKSGEWAFTLDFTIWQANEIEKLSSRTTCGEEQRKFLDEIEKMSEYIPPRKTYDRMEISASIIGSDDKDPYCYELWQCDFTADLSKVIRGE